jgi:protein SCO1/2
MTALRTALWLAVLAAAALYAVLALAPGWWRQEPATVQTGKPAIDADFALTDQLGNPRRDEDFAGKWMLVFFGFTNCPDVCPTGLATIADVMDRLGPAADEVQPLFVSVDPERDTPEALAEYVDAFHPRLVGLTGSTAKIAEAAENFRAYFEKIDDDGAPGGCTMGHTSAVYLIDPAGEFVTVYGYDERPEDIAADLDERMES